MWFHMRQQLFYIALYVCVCVCGGGWGGGYISIEVVYLQRWRGLLDLVNLITVTTKIKGSSSWRMYLLALLHTALSCPYGRRNDGVWWFGSWGGGGGVFIGVCFIQRCTLLKIKNKKMTEYPVPWRTMKRTCQTACFLASHAKGPKRAGYYRRVSSADLNILRCVIADKRQKHNICRAGLGRIALALTGRVSRIAHHR